MAAGGDSVEKRLDGTVTGLCILFRHGARSLSGNAVRGLKAALDPCHPRSRERVTNQWSEEELGDLSAIGMDQMRSLGGWAWQRLLSARARPLRDRILGRAAHVTWASSPMERVLISGRAFVSAFVNSMSEAKDEFRSRLQRALEPAPSPVGVENENSSDLFVPWAIDPKYKEWVTGIKASKAVLEEAQKRAAVIHRISQELAVLGRADAVPPADASAAPAAAESSAGSLSDDQLMKMLYFSTYMEEVVHCETHDPGTLARASASRRPGSSDPAAAAAPTTGEGDQAAGGGGSSESKDEPAVLAPSRDVMIRTLSPASLEALRAMARWVWRIRFFLNRARRLGLRMLRAILLRILPVDTLRAAGIPEAHIPPLGAASSAAGIASSGAGAGAGTGTDAGTGTGAGAGTGVDLDDSPTAAEDGVPGEGSAAPPRAPRSPDGDLLLLSGHDYTLLCLLSALRLPDYPERTVGFGSHVVMESRRSSTGDVTVTCLLNCEPFPGADRGDATGLSSEHLQVVFDDMPAESLLAMCSQEDRLPPTAADLAREAATGLTDAGGLGGDAADGAGRATAAKVGGRRGDAAGGDGSRDRALTPAGDWDALVGGKAT